jgi:hypothetical protein
LRTSALFMRMEMACFRLSTTMTPVCRDDVVGICQ